MIEKDNDNVLFRKIGRRDLFLIQEREREMSITMAVYTIVFEGT